MTGIRLVCLALSATAALAATSATARADTTAQTLPFSQDWTDAALITADDDWSDVPGVIGYRGDNLTTATGADPQTLLVEGNTTPVDVVANQATTSTAGGVIEVPGTISMQGSGTADAPHIVIALDTTGVAGVRVRYNVLDLDASADNAIQQVALHYRVGGSGDYTNVALGFVADATDASAATKITAVDVVLPANADGQALVELRIMTTNAAGNDELVGIDDILITTTALSATGTASPSSVVRGATTSLEVTVTPGSFPTSTGVTVSCDLTAIGGSATQALLDDGNGDDLFAGDNIFTVGAAIPVGTALGPVSLPCTVDDLEARTASASIALTVTDPPTNPTGIGAATPSNIAAGDTTLLTVVATAGTNPASTGIEVYCDLTPIGGAVFATLFDDGAHEDGAADDLVFGFRAISGATTAAGVKLLDCTVGDVQGRTSNTPIALTVVPVCGDGRAEGTEACDDADLDNGDGCNAICQVESGYDCTGTAPSVCTDLDECALDTDDCVAGATCADLDGSFSCSCPVGYAGDGHAAGTGCADIDECALDTDDCVAGATCADLDGSFSCSCPVGYTGDGHAAGSGCADIDECALDTDDCVAGATCADLDGSFACSCPGGYAGDGHAGGSGCADLDECALDTDDCVAGASCTDLDGSFACACPTGYTGDGHAAGSGCADIDECALATDDCVAVATCGDLDGSFACSCPTGYTGDGHAAGSGCADIDECALATDDCVASATCADTDGGFTCACPAGYGGDGRTSGTACTNNDECTLGTDTCSAFATCTDTDGSFTCACTTGFAGDGMTCAPICGDALIVSGEECDDDNADPSDGCDATCMVEDGWTCLGTPSDCSSICGDGLVRDAEECDDAGNDNGDGCDAGCVVEAGFVCDAGEPSTCSPAALCGDGMLDGGEDCDDGNTDGDDGCDATCEVESGFACDDGEPSDCERDGDGDGIGNSADNCPVDPNSAQTDSDGDGVGDVCDAELAGDGCCSTGGGDALGSLWLALATLVVVGGRRRRRARAARG